MIYVHVPFCRSFCTYCDFYSEVALKCRKEDEALKQEVLFERFAQSLLAEVRERGHEIKDEVNTLYIGGGTPSVLPLSVYGRLVKTLEDLGCRMPFDEFTIEVNPEDIVDKGPGYVEGLMELGVNRVSMGVQSFDDSILKWMNRRHTASTAVKAYRMIEDAGMENISVDLIFGLPQLSDSLWHDTLLKTLEISSKGVLPRHISSYQLSVEPGSMLAKLVDKGRWEEASDEMCGRQYDILCETLSSVGYSHYEISNFALPGYEARHNSAYWRHVPYVGFGPGAHSYLPVGVEDGETCGGRRQWNADDLEAYLAAGESGDFSPLRGGECLDREQMTMEKVMLGLRTSAGLPEDFLRSHCRVEALNEALRCGNLLILQDGNIRIPENRFFISDNIISEIVL